MKFVVFLPIALIAATLNRGCHNEEAILSGIDFNPQLHPPATTADEWMQRILLTQSLDEGYAELPPAAEWPALLQRLRLPGDELKSMQLRLFGEVLADDSAAAAESIRTLLLKKPSKAESYSRDRSLRYLYTFSKDPAEAREWVKKFLPPADPDSNSYSMPDQDIRKLLAENKIDEALLQLREKIDRDEKPSEKLSHLSYLTQLSRLLNKHPLYEDTLAETLTIAMNIPVDKIYGDYSFRSLYRELNEHKDWQSMRKIAARYRKKNSSDFHSTCSITTYQLDGPAAFLTELRRSPEFGIADEKAFLKELVKNSSTETENLGEYLIRSYMATGEAAMARITLS